MSNTKRLRELLSAATPGPWLTEIDKHTGDRIIDSDGEWVAKTDLGADHTLIVEAVNSLPSILDRLEKLEAVKDLVDEYMTHGPYWPSMGRALNDLNGDKP